MTLSNPHPCPGPKPEPQPQTGPTPKSKALTVTPNPNYNCTGLFLNKTFRSFDDRVIIKLSTIVFSSENSSRMVYFIKDQVQAEKKMVG